MKFRALEIRKEQMSPDAISIKGIRHGLLVTLHEGNWRALLAELQRRLDVNPSFFEGGQVSLDVGRLALTEQDIRSARDLLDQHGVQLYAVVSTAPETETAAQELGLVIDLGLNRRPVPEPSVESKESRLDEAVLWQRTLRSGQVIRHPGHVIVLGDVNPGAEIVAGGHVMVWGSLRGTVHAGASGDEEAIICALDMSPTQLRIAGHITRSPEGRRPDPIPEVAAVRDGQIVAMPWK
jgi:septum site-determining protein MinC